MKNSIKIKGFDIKVLVSKNPGSDEKLIEVRDDIDNYHDKVVLYSDNYGGLFNENLKDVNFLPWKRKIVKIKRGNIVIHRMFRGHGNYSVNKNEIGLTYSSIDVLKKYGEKEIGDDAELILSKGSKLCYYWNNPNHNVRVTYKLGLISLLLGLLALFELLFRYAKSITEFLII